METYFHGEVVIRKINQIPINVKTVKQTNDGYILADSETTGNHHVLEAKKGIELFEKDGILYLKNEVSAKVFCVNEGRHDTEILEPAIWEIDRAKEYDYFTQEKRNVAD